MDVFQVELLCRKKYNEKQHLVNSRYVLKQQDNKFCGDISTLFQSNCQTRISYLGRLTKAELDLAYDDLGNGF